MKLLCLIASAVLLSASAGAAGLPLWASVHGSTSLMKDVEWVAVTLNAESAPDEVSTMTSDGTDTPEGEMNEEPREQTPLPEDIDTFDDEVKREPQEEPTPKQGIEEMNASEDETEQEPSEILQETIDEALEEELRGDEEASEVETQVIEVLRGEPEPPDEPERGDEASPEVEALESDALPSDEDTPENDLERDGAQDALTETVISEVETYSLLYGDSEELSPSADSEHPIPGDDEEITDMLEEEIIPDESNENTEGE